MATIIKARAGSSLKVVFRYQNADEEPVSTTGKTATFQMRAASSPSPVLGSIVQDEGILLSPPPLAMLTLTNPGEWTLFLGKSLVSSLPPSVRWELELVNDSNTEDSETLDIGMIVVEPEVVVGVE